MSYRNTVAAVNGFQLRRHGHVVPSQVGASFESTSPVPSREPLVAKRILNQARFNLALERNKYLLELDGILPGSARQDISLENKLKGLMQQLSDLGSVDSNDPVAKERFNVINKLISNTSNRIFDLNNLISSLNVKIKEVDSRIQIIDDNEAQEKRNVLAGDDRKRLDAQNKKDLLARQQKDLEAKKRASKVAKNVPSTPSPSSTISDTPFGPQPAPQTTVETSEVVKESSGGGLGVAIGLAVVGTAIAVAANR